MSWGCQKFHFREFSVSCSQTSSCARKPLVLRHRCIVYTSMWQVSSGLKEDEMGSQGPHYVRGGCRKIIFDISRYLAPKLALVPESRLYCNKGIWIYECMCQVSLGLKEDEEGSQAPQRLYGHIFLYRIGYISTLLGLLLRN